MALQQKNTTKIFGPRPVFARRSCVRKQVVKKIGAHEMKKLFYRLSSNRSFGKLFSMHARLEEKRRVMFPKSSVCAVVALAAFMSLGAFLFPQVGHAQECVW